MRAVFINHVSPDAPTVGGKRIAALAEAAAGLGHRMVLLTETPRPEDDGTPLETLPDALAGHDWSRPFAVAVKPRPAPYLPRMRTGRIAPGLRQAMIGLSYFVNSGMFTDWSDAARPYVAALGRAFVPEIAWACFGNTDSWNIGQAFQRTCGCPWAADVKDTWENFIPPGLRGLIARRYRDCAAITALSATHAAEAERWHRAPKTVVYSGLPAAFLDEAPAAADEPPTLMVTGSVYDAANLRRFVDAFATWLDGRTGVFRFAYAGADATLVRDAARSLVERCEVSVEDFLPLADLRRRQRAARANAYLRAPSGTFHHKVVELLSAGRPVICFPRDIAEALTIAADTGGRLHNCAGADDLHRAFEESLVGDDRLVVDPAVYRRFSWEAQAAVLMEVLAGAAGR